MSAPGRVLAVVALATAATAAVAGPGVAAQSSGSSPARAAAVVSTGFVALTPTRILDTRTSPIIHRLGPASITNVTVAGLAGVPATGVEAVVLNVTGIARTSSAYLSVYPAGARLPKASSVTLAIGKPRANQVIAQIGNGGAVAIYNSAGSTDVVVDVSGYFRVGSTYTGQRPRRILDIRGSGLAEPMCCGERRSFPLAGRAGVPATGASAVAINVTGINHGQGSSFLTIYDVHNFTSATTSNLSLGAGETAAVLVIAPLSTDGQIGFRVAGSSTDVILDVQGSFTGTTDYHPIPATRILDSRVTGALGYLADTPLKVGWLTGVPVPSTAGAVVLSVTAVKPSLSGYLTVHPGGTAVPGTSNLNVQAGATTANLVIAQLDSQGRIAIFDALKDAGVLVDVVGWLDTAQAP